MKSFLELVRFYHGMLGKKLFFLILLSTVAAVLEITSIGFFMPLLSGIKSVNPVNKIFTQGFSFLHIEFTITNILIAFLVLIFLRTAVLLFESEYTGKMTSRMLVDLRQELARKIFRINYLKYIGRSSAYLNNAIIVESQNVTFAFRMLASLIVSTLLALAYSFMPIILNPTLVLILVTVFAVLYPVLKVINRNTKRLSVLHSKHSAELQKVLIQSLNNFKYLKATGAHRQVSMHVDSQSSKLGALQQRLTFLQGISDHGFEPIIALLVTGAIFYFIVIKNGNISEFVFLVFMLMTTR